MEWVLAVIAICAFFLALILPTVAYPVLLKIGAVDIPNHRSSHATPTIRGIGVVTALILVVALTAAVLLTNVSEGMLIIVGAAAVASSSVGFIEDVRGISTSIRAGLQLLIGIGVVWVLVQDVSLPIWAFLVGVVFIAGYINVANFMDGINGISGLHGIVVGLTYSSIGILADLEWLTVTGLVLAVVFSAFLPWNLSPRSVFLGDVGSYLLGCTIAVLGTAAVISGISVLVVIGPLVVYLADTGWTLIRRALRGKEMFVAHREHVYQQLAVTTARHLPVAIYVSFLSGIGAFVSILIQIQQLSAAIGSVVLGALTLLYISTPHLHRFKKVSKATEGFE